MYKSFIRPFLEKSDHEDTKAKTIDLIHLFESNIIGLKVFEKLAAYKGKRFRDPKLKTLVAGIEFDNPLLLAAGWDREGRAVKGMYQLGFGGIEVGTVTAYPQPGNARPRLHLLNHDVALNHFGFSGPGMERVAQNLVRYQKSGIPIGANVVKNKYADPLGAPPFYAVVIRRLYELVDYFVINVSSPNTAGLKVLQNKKYLSEIVKNSLTMMDDIGGRKPLFIKIAPDIPYKTLDELIQLVVDNNLAGIIAVNTYPHENTIAKYGVSWEARQGGLSGNDRNYRNIGARYLAYIHNQTQGKVITIGVGGVHDTQTALEKIAAGATLIQSLTGLITEGPSLPGKINRGLVEFMDREKIKSLDEIRGTDAKQILENKNGYSFSFQPQAHSLESLKKEYLQAVFQQEKLDTLLISKNPYQLKHGEFGRKTSHIYLNHRIPLFNSREYRKLFGKILNYIIQEKWEINDFGLISVPSTGSPDLINSLMETSNGKLSKLVVLPKGLTQEEKGTSTTLYGNIDDRKQWFMVDDVFTSGKTMKDVISIIKTNKSLSKNIAAVSLVARNTHTIETFENKTGSKMIPFLTLDEILMYHWKNFSPIQKKLIQLERTTLN